MEKKCNHKCTTRYTPETGVICLGCNKKLIMIQVTEEEARQFKKGYELVPPTTPTDLKIIKTWKQLKKENGKEKDELSTQKQMSEKLANSLKRINHFYLNEDAPMETEEDKIYQEKEHDAMWSEHDTVIEEYNQLNKQGDGNAGRSY